MILPELEQQALVQSYSRSRQPIHLPGQLTVRTTSLGVFLCPADSMPHRWTASDGEVWLYMGKIYSATDPICDVAGSNYVGVFGIGEPGVNGDGVFYRNSFTGYSDITDGLSQTLCVGERSTNLEPGTRPGHLGGCRPRRVILVVCS